MRVSAWNFDSACLSYAWHWLAPVAFRKNAAGMDPEFKKAWLQSWKWAAITAAVVTSPVIGKVAKVSFERFLGTIAGRLSRLQNVTVYLLTSFCMQR